MRIAKEITGLVHGRVRQVELFEHGGEIGLGPLPEDLCDFRNEPAALVDAVLAGGETRIAQPVSPIEGAAEGLPLLLAYNGDEELRAVAGVEQIIDGPWTVLDGIRD